MAFAGVPQLPEGEHDGACRVAAPTGQFLGLVCCNSLESVQTRTHRLRISKAARAILDGLDSGARSLTAARDAMDSLALSPIAQANSWRAQHQPTV